MEVTERELGKVNDCRLVQPENEDAGIEVKLVHAERSIAKDEPRTSHAQFAQTPAIKAAQIEVLVGAGGALVTDEFRNALSPAKTEAGKVRVAGSWLQF